MMRIVIFGAGGRAGRTAVAEAEARGHEVTAVVRDPTKHRELGAARVVAGDVSVAADVARLATGQGAAINAAADIAAPADVFFPGAASALDTGLAPAGVSRLLFVGLASVLPGASGVPLMDEPGYPNEYRPFMLGHAAGLERLRGSALDWVYAAPAGDFDHGAGRTGRYRIADHADRDDRISYPDLAVALLDEIERPRHHRSPLAIGGAAPANGSA
ncbi:MULTISPECIES: NAD(P)-dependent oxidoreductase [Streptomyces]|nr:MULTISPECIES: NAD(P)H-binding protein [Streptomyces]